MSISDRFPGIRQLLPGAQAPQEDERLLQLYWNRAELKKELSRLQKEKLTLQERLKKQEALTARADAMLLELEQHLGEPEVAVHALAYFQLRSLWRLGCERLQRFSQHLRQQQEDRERRRQQIEFDQSRQSKLADLDRALFEARSTVDLLEAQLKLSQARLGLMRGFWNYFRRRKLSEEIEREREQWDAAVTRVTDLSDDRADVEAQAPPPSSGLSIDGKRAVNTATIAYAQQLLTLLMEGGVALLARETNTKRVYDVRYGSREECARLMSHLRTHAMILNDDADDVTALKSRTDAIRAQAIYRSDADTVPLTDSIGTVPGPTAPVSGLDTIARAGINVLVDDYWDVYLCLMQ
ncbi:MAG TPA: hypothetical protein VJS42_02610 [Steroidobacteraceae bacterium]|nr:hypothetical protein [Steroidobacteraceae bacterium]